MPNTYTLISSVTVGAGGAGGAANGGNSGVQGSNSSFGSLICKIALPHF